MAACASCTHLDLQKGICNVSHRKPLRNCLTPILNGYHTLLKPGCTVLEVGCGAWSPTREYCKEIGATWEGIDILEVYMGKKTIATKIASVAAIPFPDQSFDFVIANQSMEHWEENYVPIEQGLNEIFRVLKTGGLALLNVPIHYHGDYRFVSGRLPEVKSLFSPYADEVVLESWRSPSHPLPEIYHLKKSYWFNSALKNQPAYLLDIRARRKEKYDTVPISKTNPTLKLIRGLQKRSILYYVTVVTLLVIRQVRKLVG